MTNANRGADVVVNVTWAQDVVAIAIVKVDVGILIGDAKSGIRIPMDWRTFPSHCAWSAPRYVD
jgi:hypothetical protein